MEDQSTLFDSSIDNDPAGDDHYKRNRSAHFLWFMALCVLSILGTSVAFLASRWRQPVSPISSPTWALLGTSCMSPDSHKVVFAGVRHDGISCGVGASWNSSTGIFVWDKADWGNIGLLELVQMGFVPGRNHAWILQQRGRSGNGGEGSKEASNTRRMLTIINADNLTSVNQFDLPDGPAVGCFVNPDIIVVPCAVVAGSSEQDGNLTVWQIGTRELKKVGEIHLPEGMSVGGIRHAANDVVLFPACFLYGESLHCSGSFNVSQPPTVERVVDGARSQVSDPPAPRLTTDANPSPAMEIVACDISARRILSRQPTAALGWWDCVRIGKDGKYAAVLGRKTIELRSVPSLTLLKRAEVDFGDFGCGAISADGRYVAFGYKRLEIWDTVSGEIRLLDKLNEDTVDSSGFRVVDPEKRHWGLQQAAAVHQRCLASLEFIGDHDELAGVTHDGVFYLWDVSAGKQVRRSRMIEVEYIGE